MRQLVETKHYSIGSLQKKIRKSEVKESRNTHLRLMHKNDVKVSSRS